MDLDELSSESDDEGQLIVEGGEFAGDSETVGERVEDEHLLHEVVQVGKPDFVEDFALEVFRNPMFLGALDVYSQFV